MQRLTQLFSLAYVFVAAIPNPTPVEDRVLNDVARADFTYHSSVLPDSGAKFKLTNFIRNNRADNPLSVTWKDGGIFCIGSRQLPPGATDRGNTGDIIESPTVVKSRIDYGARLQYSAAAQVYVEPKGSEARAETKRSEYSRQLKDGSVPIRIEVISTLNESRRAADLTFRVVGGFNLAIPMKLGGVIKSSPSLATSKTWKLFESDTIVVDQFGLRDGSFQALTRDWLRTNDQVDYRFFVTLQNLFPKASNDITIRISGVSWTLEKINLIAFDEDRSGMVGMTATVYVPRLQ